MERHFSNTTPSSHVDPPGIRIPLPDFFPSSDDEGEYSDDEGESSGEERAEKDLETWIPKAGAMAATTSIGFPSVSGGPQFGNSSLLNEEKKLIHYPKRHGELKSMKTGERELCRDPTAPTSISTTAGRRLLAKSGKEKLFKLEKIAEQLKGSDSSSFRHIEEEIDPTIEVRGTNASSRRSELATIEECQLDAGSVPSSQMQEEEEEEEGVESQSFGQSNPHLVQAILVEERLCSQQTQLIVEAQPVSQNKVKSLVYILLAVTAVVVIVVALVMSLTSGNKQKARSLIQLAPPPGHYNVFERRESYDVAY